MVIWKVSMQSQTRESSRLRNTLLLTTLAVLSSTVNLLAAGDVTVFHMSGEWHGQSRFTGINYEEATQKKVPPRDVLIVMQISDDGKVTGRIGGAELTNGVVSANRGWFGRHLHLWTDFIIRGQIAGPVAPGSENGTHPINAPFDFDGTNISGSLFVVHPPGYPYPFLSLHLSR
jgi:hypothetical protein